jgi:FixJ family two-component response regulator
MAEHSKSGDGASPHVYVVDDDLPALKMTARLLSRAGYRVGSYASPVTFLDEARLTPPCCLVLDVQMPGLSGLEVQSRVAGAPVPPAVVFVSGGADVPTSVGAMKAGAVDFLVKPFSASELLAAVKVGLERAAERLAEHVEIGAARRRLARLTPRERQVCDQVVAGLKSREIAKALGLAEKTVNIHRGRVMGKLGVTSVASLVRLLARASDPGA